MKNFEYVSPFFEDDRLRDVDAHFNWLLENIDGLIEDVSNVWINASTDSCLDKQVCLDSTDFYGWSYSDVVKKLFPDEYEGLRDCFIEETREGIPIAHTTETVRELFAIRDEFAETMLIVAKKMAALHERGRNVKMQWDAEGEEEFFSRVYQERLYR